MSLFRKAITGVFSRMSKKFRYLLVTGYIIFILQLAASAALYFAFLSSSQFMPGLRDMAAIISKNALSFFTVVIIVCVTGDFIIDGE